MGDGAVKFITDSIDAGNGNARQVSYHGQPTQPAPGSASQYGLWGSLGSRANKEIIDGEF